MARPQPARLLHVLYRLAEVAGVTAVTLLVACSSNSTSNTKRATNNANSAATVGTQAAAVGRQATAAVSQSATSGSQATTASSPATAAKVAPGKLDPCTLVTRADVEAVVAKVKGNALPSDSAQFGGSRCYYDADGVPNGVTFSVYQSGNKTSAGATVDAVAFYNSEKNALGNDAVPQAGLGDDAYWIPQSLSLRVLKQNAYLTLTVGVTDPAVSLQKAKDLMLKVLAKF